MQNNEELNIEDKIQYIHEITSIIVKNTKADKMFKELYKSKKQVKQFLLPDLQLPLNDTDFLEMTVSQRVRGDKYNTYVVKVVTYAGSDTYKYLNERQLNELQKNK